MNSGSAARHSCWPRLAVILGTAVNAFRATALDGAVDPTFRPPFLNPISDLIVLQPDGKCLVSFGSAGGAVGLVRLHTNGLPDATFNTGKGALIVIPPVPPSPTPWGLCCGVPGATNTAIIAAVALQSGGRIIVGGTFSHFDDTAKSRNLLVRLSSNGVVDANFTTTNLLAKGRDRTVVQALAVDDADRIYAGGIFTTVNNLNRSTSLIRLEADGTLDNSFGDVTLAGLGSASIDAITIQPDQKVLVTTTYFAANYAETMQVLRLMPSGELDPTFQKSTGRTVNYGPPGDPLSRQYSFPPLQSHLLLPNGQIIVTIPAPYGGLTYNGVKITGSLFRLNADGIVDPKFQSPQLKLGNSGVPVYRMAAAKDGRVYVAGSFEIAGNIFQDGLIRLLGDGDFDPTFVPVSAAGGLGGYALAVQPDGKVIAQTSIFDGALNYGVVRLLVGDDGGAVIPPPILTFQINGGTTLHVTIPAGFHLERTPSLSPPTWEVLPATETADVPITGPGAYFRLAAVTP